tara:strand:+ start:1082 stop:1240 length:159 start_codon:yes stop_codon:yes gene_type:complete
MNGLTEVFIWILFGLVVGELVWKIYHKKVIGALIGATEYIVSIKEKQLEEEK